jgi:stress response protein SCP2
MLLSLPILMLGGVVVIIYICCDRHFCFYSILDSNAVDIHSKSDNIDENIMNIMMLTLDHVCGMIMMSSQSDTKSVKKNTFSELKATICLAVNADVGINLNPK